MSAAGDGGPIAGRDLGLNQARVGKGGDRKKINKVLDKKA